MKDRIPFHTQCLSCRRRDEMKDNDRCKVDGRLLGYSDCSFENLNCSGYFGGVNNLEVVK